MTTPNASREQTWNRLESHGPWDLVIVGGGITGAGLLYEATRRGLDALLVEQGDFASGTSSRSSKLVHGGLRYLAQGDLRLTWQAVRERERLLHGAARAGGADRLPDGELRRRPHGQAHAARGPAALRSSSAAACRTAS